MKEATVVERITRNEEPTSEPACKINFENIQNRVYYPGQVVSGCASLTINETVTVRAIYANIVGRGYCKWQTRSGSGRNRHSTTHMKEEFYMNRKIYYVGDQNMSSRSVVQPGDYKYQFNCDIPDECHTSLEETTGFIRYSVALVIEEDVNKKKEFVESFTVINPLNLNDDESYSYPMSDGVELIFNKYCCCLCCWETEPVKMSVKVPMKGYAPGQAIEITINVDNKSDQTYNEFIGNIYKKVEFYANERISSKKGILTTVKCEGCPAGESLARKLIITVPPTPRTETCNICSITYELEVVAFADCCRDACRINFPITIGTYPIQRTNTQTSGIVVTQQPTAGLIEGVEFHSSSLIEPLPSQSQPLLVKETVSTQKCSQSGTRSVSQPTINDSHAFLVGDSSLSDKDLESSFRPLYPVYTSNQFPLACNLKVEAMEMKQIKM